MSTAVIEIRDVVTQDVESSIFISTPTTEYILIDKDNSSLVLAGGLGPQGAPGVSEEDVMYSKRVDFITDLELYRGEAAVGSSESSAVWRIRKVTLAIDGDVAEKWASGTALFDKVWADRASLTYT